MAIRFHTQEIKFDLPQKNLHKSWIYKAILEHSRTAGSINFIFTSNAHLRRMNQSYLNHDYFTDVITFDYSKEKALSGDVFISIDQVKINARTYHTEMYEELRRVMIHGVLHLIGFKDASTGEMEQMRKMENDALHLWSKE